MAVIFAMLASYFLSRTVVPTMVRFLLREHLDEIDTSLAHGLDEPNGSEEKIDNRYREDRTAARRSVPGQIFGFMSRIHEKFNHVFEKVRARYVNALRWCLEHRRVVFAGMGAMVLISFSLIPFLGRDFFPAVDAGQFRLHVRAPAGTRLESTKERFFQVGHAIREVIPPNEIQNVLDNIGLPTSGINLAFGDSSTISSADGEILVALNPNHKPTEQYVRILREKLHHDFPDMEFFFSAPDIVSQILNFGIPSPIDIQITGRDPKGYDIASQIKTRVAQIPGAVDVHVHQLVHGPNRSA
jgi:multidrug efflux pump subunit AcrB